MFVGSSGLNLIILFTKLWFVGWSERKPCIWSRYLAQVRERKKPRNWSPTSRIKACTSKRPLATLPTRWHCRRFFWAADEGRLFDGQAMFDRLTLAAQYIPIPELEILVLFDYLCDPSLSLWKASPSSASRLRH